MSNTENNYQETDLGNVAPHPADEYDPKASYEYLDVVNYKGGSYICRVEDRTVTGIAPAHGKNTDIWQLLTLPGIASRHQQRVFGHRSSTCRPMRARTA